MPLFHKVGLLVVGLALLAACGGQETAAPAEAPHTPAAAEAPAAPPVSSEISPDAYRGSAIAQQVCVQCHDIGIPGMAPAIKVGAPDFAVLANGDGVSAASLAQWMRTSHPAMPNFIFDDSSVTALSAYIMSLHKAQ